MNQEALEVARCGAMNAAFEEGDSADVIYDKAYASAIGALELCDLDLEGPEANAIARLAAQEVAQP